MNIHLFSKKMDKYTQNMLKVHYIVRLSSILLLSFWRLHKQTISCQFRLQTNTHY